MNYNTYSKTSLPQRRYVMNLFSYLLTDVILTREDTLYIWIVLKRELGPLVSRRRGVDHTIDRS